MKKIFIYSLLSCVLSNLVYSQDTITVYYDKDWKDEGKDAYNKSTAY